MFSAKGEHSFLYFGCTMNITNIPKSRPAQHGLQAWKAQTSIRSYSEIPPAVSGMFGPPHLSEEETLKLKDCLAVAAPTPLTPHLCYACHTMLTSRNSRGTAAFHLAAKSLRSVSLPIWAESVLGSNVVGHQNGIGDDIRPTRGCSRQDLKAQIEEFIICDD